MSVLPVGQGSSTGYQIPNSLRFRASNNAYLSRTFGTPTSNTTWSYSLWVKKGISGSILSGGTDCEIYFNATGNLVLFKGGVGSYSSTAVFRDPSAHMHIFIRSNGTNIKAYRNNEEILSYTGTMTDLNSATAHRIGRHIPSGDDFDGLLSEINFIDGQALTPSSFGETNSDGVWVPKRYTGTYGTNGFYLDFKDGNLTSGSNAGLGKDVSGNGNYWNTNGISVTSGVTYDWMYDTPTNNYATWNRLDLRVSPSSTFADANLSATVGGAASTEEVCATLPFPASTTSWVEVTCSNIASGNARVGIANLAFSIDTRNSNGYLYQQDGQKFVLGSASAYGSTYTTADVIGILFDSAAGSITFYKQTGGTGNFVSQGAITGISTSATWILSTTGRATVWVLNAGQRTFNYVTQHGSLPSSAKPLCTANLPAVTITNPRKHFDVALWTGDSSTSRQVVTGLQFQPDFSWIKARNSANLHTLSDAVRGGGKSLISNTTDAEETNAAYGYLSAFNSDGVTVAKGATDATRVNNTGTTYVDWLWKANGAGVSNTDGSIPSTVSANTTAGFSIVTYTGTGSAATIGHGLGKVPSLIIAKDRTSGSRTADQWPVYHSSLAITSGEHLYLYSTGAKATSSTVFNSTLATSSVFSVGTWGGINYLNDTFVAYVFAEIPGFSKFGSYTSNNSSDGPYVHCGFRPRYILIKATTAIAGNWAIIDTARDTYNVMSAAGIYANLPNAETTVALCDATANGFKIRTVATNINNSTTTDTYIYAAFAEFPNGSNVAPSPAR